MTVAPGFRIRAALAACALSLLAACGSDPDREGTFALAQAASATALGPLFGESADLPPQAANTPETLAPILAQFPPGPALRFDVLSLDQSALAFTTATNGPYRTFATVTAQTITLRGGLVTSTRGFGWDLMSSATNGAAEIIRRRGSGTVDRIYRYLSAMDDEVETVARCSIAPEGSETITLASGARFATTRLRETCEIGDQSARETFTNRYWVTAGGAIPRSEQRISDRIGALRIEVIRN